MVTYLYTYNKREMGHIPTFFRHRNLRFLTHDGALGVKMGGYESYGRPAPFLDGSNPLKIPTRKSKNGFPLNILGWILVGQKISNK